jgi:hypothetical protein
MVVRKETRKMPGSEGGFVVSMDSGRALMVMFNYI